MSTSALDTVYLAAGSYTVPAWGIPIILIVALGAAWYRKKRDSDR